MSFGFPTSPSNGDTYSKWVYDAAKGAWVLQSATGTLTDIIIDEDDMISNDAGKVPSQQSTKAYVDNSVQNIDVDQLLADDIVTEAEGIASNDDDAHIPTTAAVKDYVDTTIPATLLDEDTMASDDATRAPTQQSTKAYVDNSIAGINGLAVSQFDGSAIITEAEGILSNDNDTTLPTSAAVRDYVDANAGYWTQTGSDIYYNTGNVGIGTTSPASPLHVKVATNANFEVESSSGTLRLSSLNDARSANSAMQFASSAFSFITGNVGIGTTNPGSYLAEGSHLVLAGTGHVGMTISSGTTSEGGIYFADGTTGSDAYKGIIRYNQGSDYLSFYANATEGMRLLSDRTLHVDNDVVAFSTTISDQSLKDNVTTIDNALDKVLALRGVEYDWNAGSKKGEHDLGVIAQEVEAVLPDIVTEHEMVFEDNRVVKTVDYEKLTAVLIEAVKELTARVEELESGK